MEILLHFPFLYLLLIFVSHSLMRTKIHTIIFTLLQKNDPDAVKDQQVFIHKSMLLAIFRNNKTILITTLLPVQMYSHIYIYIYICAVRCTREGYDRYSPNLGGCCTGLYETNEPRLTSERGYCPSSDPNHNKNCWSTRQVCRSSGSSII